jgi:AMIN domain
MSRFPHTALPLAIGAVFVGSICAPLAAQTPAAATAKSTMANARVQHVAVRGTVDSAEVDIQTSGTAVAPDTQVVSGPNRIIVDFPGALPAAELHALAMKVNYGALKGVRAGLFFNNPPITRIVLDLAEARSYQITTANNETVVKLGPATADAAKSGHAKINTVAEVRSDSPDASIVRTPKLQNALLGSSPRVDAKPEKKAEPQLQASIAQTPVTNPAAVIPPVPPPPPPAPVTVTYTNGMLRIQADKATLAQVLYEVSQRTQAEIAIPAGAEQEQVISDLGPGSARDVLGALLNGSPYNFIFIGDQVLERVILTKRDPDIF